MQKVSIDQDHKDSSTESGREPSRREAEGGAQRRVVTFQSRVALRVLHCVCRSVHEICVCGHA